MNLPKKVQKIFLKPKLCYFQNAWQTRTAKMTASQPAMQTTYALVRYGD